MADRDEHWLGAGARAQHHANLFASVDERHSGPALIRHWRVATNQQRFCAADRGMPVSRPTWQAIPKRRGWAMPWPSQISKSGRTRSCSIAAITAGASRKERKPGTYGNVAGRRAIA